jgi:hypothetical protein
VRQCRGRAHSAWACVLARSSRLLDKLAWTIWPLGSPTTGVQESTRHLGLHAPIRVGSHFRVGKGSAQTRGLRPREVSLLSLHLGRMGLDADLDGIRQCRKSAGKLRRAGWVPTLATSSQRRRQFGVVAPRSIRAGPCGDVAADIAAAAGTAACFARRQLPSCPAPSVLPRGEVDPGALGCGLRLRLGGPGALAIMEMIGHAGLAANF